MIGIVDYGMGNLRSVQNALDRLEHEAAILADPHALAECDKLILPGVGAFRDAIAELNSSGFVEPLAEHVSAGKPLLGICLGMQLVMGRSFEDGEYEGLGYVAGDVIRFEEAPGLKIPHMGWNRLLIRQESPLLDGLPEEAYVYFVHSYHVQPGDASVVLAETDHGVSFPSVLRKGSLYATQFHPEKSQAVGMKILDNFARKC